MPDKKVLTGLDWAFVKTKRSAPEDFVQVYEGQELPSDIAAGEVDRLTGLGAFDDHPRVAHDALIQQQLAAQAAAGMPTSLPAEPGDDDMDDDDSGQSDDGEGRDALPPAV